MKNYGGGVKKMKLENHLKKLSEENDEYLKLFEVWRVIKSNICNILNDVSVYFPHFSLHNESHSKTICLQVERLLGDERISKLSITDTLLLLLVFYLHDVGMAVRYEEIYNFFKSSNFKSKLIDLIGSTDEDISNAARRLQNFEDYNANGEITEELYTSSLEVYNDVILIIENVFRSQHAKQSAEFIEEKMNFMNSIGDRFVKLTSQICKLHQENIEMILELPYKSNGIMDDYVHPRFIASMLCIGDLLDLDTDRFNEQSLKIVSPMPKSSKLHMEKHKSIEHFLVEPNGIEIKSNSNSIKVYRVMRDWTDWIKKTCDFLAINWSQIAPREFDRAPYLKKCDLLVNNSTNWLQYSDLKFTISNKKAFELLQGAGIYKHKFVCIREIIQNSIDATVIRIWQDECKKRNLNINSKPKDFMDIDIDKYKITADVNLSQDGEVVVKIRDYGTGISIDDLKCICNVGSSKNVEKNKIIKEMPDWFKPSGYFGMGIQSIFLLTDKFEIITKTNNDVTKKITFENSKNTGYIIIEDYNERFEQGTELAFIIDNSKIEYKDLECSEYYYETLPKSKLILEAISNKYNNLEKRSISTLEKQVQTYDYIPVEMSVYNTDSKESEIILKYISILEKIKDMKVFTITKNSINIENYNNTFDCIVKVDMCMLDNKDHIYNTKNIFYGTRDSILFYKNVFVCRDDFFRGIIGNRAIIDHIDFSINTLSINAGKLLNLSRNSIRNNFKAEYKNMCLKILKEEICLLIDRLLRSEEDIGDIAIMVYQFSKYYNYKYKEIKNKYEHVLQNLKFDNYYNINHEQKTLSFKDVDENKLYFIYGDEIEEKLIREEDEIKDLSAKKEFCFYMKERKAERNLIYSRVDNMYIARIDNKLYKIIEVTNMESNKKGIICEKDNYLILEDFIGALFYSIRVVDALKGYEKIVTPINLVGGICNYYIELPIGYELRKKIFNELQDKYIVKNAINRYKKQIVEDELFEKNIKYIAGYNSAESEVIRNKYLEFIDLILGLIEDEGYKNYIKNYIDDLKQNDRRIESINYNIQNNDYITLY